MRRAFVIILALWLCLSSFILFPEASAAFSSHTWTSAADWLSGSMDSNLVLVGTGEPSYLELRKGDFSNWMEMYPPLAPQHRNFACLAWIDLDDTFLMFGGNRLSGMLNDTWKYNFTNDKWTKLMPAHAPSPRSYHGCAYDPVQQAVVLFGGMDSLGKWRSDTWQFDVHTNDWKQVVPVGDNPNTVQMAQLAYDMKAGKTILVSLNFVSGEMETWAYDSAANTWTNMNPTSNLTPRDGHAIAFDKVSNRTILFGGGLDLDVFCDTWEYEVASNAWQRTWFCTPGGGSGPWPRVFHSLAFAEALGGVLMFGGKNEMTYELGTYVYVQGFGGWIEPLFGGTTPSQREGHAMASAPGDASVLLFGGYHTSEGFMNETWVFGRRYLQNVDAVWESGVTNTGCTSPDYANIWFNQTSITKPPNTILRFQIATSPNPEGPWLFLGPGGYPGNHYRTEGEAIDPIHDYQQYVRVRAKLKTLNGRFSPHLEDLAITWVCPPGPPYIASTNPSDGSMAHPIDAPILVNFSEPMDTATVNWTITGGIALADSWSNGNRTLTLAPNPQFASCTRYMVNVTQGKSETGQDLVPGPVPNPWSFVTYCPDPYIVLTDPEDGETGVPFARNILVIFSESMNTTTVTWDIVPYVNLTGSWDSMGSILTLSHMLMPFEECVSYTVDIAGESATGIALISGPAPNPWTFTAVCIHPFIVLTDPAHRRINIPLDKVINVTFSEPMNTTTVTWTITPYVDLTPSWNSARTNLYLTPSPSLLEFTWHKVNITSGKDDQGLDLVPKVAPNPWEFRTASLPPHGPYHLRVTLMGSDVHLSWSLLPSATSYRVYETQDRFASFPSGWNLIGSPIASPFIATGHGTDGLTHYYIVRGYDGSQESPNSTMGVKKTFSFTYSSATSNIQWFSLPYTSNYTRASDIASELGSTKIDVIGKWDPEQQRAIVFYYARGKWRGTDFNITAGDGLYLSICQSFEWNLTGTDANVTLTFTPNPPPKENVNWVGIPYTGIYSKASDISSRLRSTRISEVGLWDAATQTVVRWYWDGSMWTGTDFTFEPGAGIRG